MHWSKQKAPLPLKINVEFILYTIGNCVYNLKTLKALTFDIKINFRHQNI